MLGQPPPFPVQLGDLCPCHTAPIAWELEEPIFKVTAHLFVHERCWLDEAMHKLSCCRCFHIIDAATFLDGFASDR